VVVLDGDLRFVQPHIGHGALDRRDFLSARCDQHAPGYRTVTGQRGLVCELDRIRIEAAHRLAPAVPICTGLPIGVGDLLHGHRFITRVP
jgi:hypothetical protein